LMGRLLAVMASRSRRELSSLPDISATRRPTARTLMRNVRWMRRREKEKS
jgi:hypothetical protein